MIVAVLKNTFILSVKVIDESYKVKHLEWRFESIEDLIEFYNNATDLQTNLHRMLVCQNQSGK